MSLLRGDGVAWGWCFGGFSGSWNGGIGSAGASPSRGGVRRAHRNHRFACDEECG